MSERVPLFDSYYFAFWEDGTFGHSDGVGFCGETSAEEVRALFEVMQKFYAAQQSVQPTGGILPDFLASLTPEQLSALKVLLTPPTSG